VNPIPPVLRPLFRWAVRSRVVLLAFGAGLLFLFCNGSSEFGSGGDRDPDTGVQTWENYRTHSTGFPAWLVQSERTWGEERRDPDGAVKRVATGVESEGRIVWTSLAWLYPLSFAVLFCVREWWLLREARAAKETKPAEVSNTR
jgi:hypothetical protein